MLSCGGERRAAQRGWTLLEACVAAAVAAVLAAVAFPSFEAQIVKSRRADAIAALFRTQMAQERWRANQPRYGSLAEIGAPPRSSAGHYAIAVTASSETSYELLATAQGRQQRDGECRHLKLAMIGSDVVHASGPDAAASNPDAVNRRCWSL